MVPSQNKGQGPNSYIHVSTTLYDCYGAPNVDPYCTPRKSLFSVYIKTIRCEVHAIPNFTLSTSANGYRWGKILEISLSTVNTEGGCANPLLSSLADTCTPPPSPDSAFNLGTDNERDLRPDEILLIPPPPQPINPMQYSGSTTKAITRGFIILLFM